MFFYRLQKRIQIDIVIIYFVKYFLFKNYIELKDLKYILVKRNNIKKYFVSNLSFLYLKKIIKGL